MLPSSFVQPYNFPMAQRSFILVVVLDVRWPNHSTLFFEDFWQPRVSEMWFSVTWMGPPNGSSSFSVAIGSSIPAHCATR